MAKPSRTYDEVVSANRDYAKNFGDKGKLALPPARRFAILTCMDARLDPAKYAGLAEGDAHVIRNAGGRASDDAIRSLVISHKLLGTHEWFVVHHSDCGMQLFTGEIIGNLLEDNLETAQFDGKTWSNPKHGGGSVAGHYIHWHTFDDNAKSVTEDVQRIRSHPLVPKHIPIYGFIYDVKTGKLDEVAEAPILRPLIGMDKIEITEAAQRLGTFEISIEPDADCCTLFVPKHPVTRMDREEIAAVEARLDIPRLVTQGVEAATQETFDFPPGAGPWPPRGAPARPVQEPIRE